MLVHEPCSCPSELSDAQLVGRFKGGDREVFLELMSRHRSRVHAAAQRILGSHADAEEIAQDVFVKAYLGLHAFREESSFSTWIYRITMNLARNRYWYYSRRRRGSTFSLDRIDETGRTPTAPPLDSGPTPSEATLASDFDAHLSQCFRKLDERHREILTLRNVLELSYEEIAQQLSINIGTVKSRIARAREGLRGLLAESYPEFLAK